MLQDHAKLVQFIRKATEVRGRKKLQKMIYIAKRCGVAFNEKKCISSICLFCYTLLIIKQDFIINILTTFSARKYIPFYTFMHVFISCLLNSLNFCNFYPTYTNRQARRQKVTA